MKNIQRIPNFTPTEKEFLMELVFKYAYILEDKKTNKITMEKKQQIWNQIEAEFNNKGPIVTYRNEDQLKRLYENKKKELRKKIAQHKSELYRTGGGPPPDEPKLDKCEEILMKIINEKTVYGFPAAFDSDALDANPLTEVPQNHVEINDLDDIECTFETVCEEEIVDVPNQLNQRYPPSGLQKMNDKLKLHREPDKLQGDHDYCTNSRSTQNTVSTTDNKIPPTTNTKTHNPSRRRPMSGVRALTTSDISEKYNLLLDKRLILVQKQIEHSDECHNAFKEEQSMKMRVLKHQEDILSIEKEEKKLKVELLKKSLLSPSI